MAARSPSPRIGSVSPLSYSSLLSPSYRRRLWGRSCSPGSQSCGTPRRAARNWSHQDSLRHAVEYKRKQGDTPPEHPVHVQMQQEAESKRQQELERRKKRTDMRPWREEAPKLSHGQEKVMDSIQGLPNPQAPLAKSQEEGSDFGRIANPFAMLLDNNVKRGGLGFTSSTPRFPGYEVQKSPRTRKRSEAAPSQQSSAIGFRFGSEEPRAPSQSMDGSMLQTQRTHSRGSEDKPKAPSESLDGGLPGLQEVAESQEGEDVEAQTVTTVHHDGERSQVGFTAEQMQRTVQPVHPSISTADRLKSTIGPTFGKGTRGHGRAVHTARVDFITDDRDPRCISFRAAASANSVSSWAQSRSPKIGIYRRTE